MSEKRRPGTASSPKITGSQSVKYQTDLFYCAQDIGAVVCPFIYHYDTHTGDGFRTVRHLGIIVRTDRTCVSGSGGNYPDRVIFFSTLAPGSGNFQLSRLAGLGYGLGLRFWVLFTIIVSLTLTLTPFTTLTEISP